MENDKELIRKDLAIILKLDAQIDYSQRSIVENYYKDITRKGLLMTPYGKRYMRRLEQIIAGDNIHNKCAFCNSQTQGDTLICPACMAKLRKPSAVYCRSCGNKMNTSETICSACGKNKDEGYKYCAHCGKEVPIPNMEILTNDAKNKSKEFAEQATKIAKENVQNIAEKGTKLAKDMSADTKFSNNKKTGNKKKAKGQKNMNKKSILVWLVFLFIAVAIIGTVGLDTTLALFAFASLIVLTYKVIKKKPKKNAVIAFVVFFLLSGIVGDLNCSGGMGDNILDYIGTKESTVYKTYDKDDFKSFQGLLTNEKTDTKGLPYIRLDDSNPRLVYSIILESGMNASFNVNGLHIGDSVDQVEKCMKKLKAVYDSDESNELTAWSYAAAIARNQDVSGKNIPEIMVYDLEYHGKKIQIIITVIGGYVNRISVSGS